MIRLRQTMRQITFRQQTASAPWLFCAAAAPRFTILTPSDSRTTVDPVASIFPHMAADSGTVLKNIPPNWVITNCSPKVAPNTPNIRRLFAIFLKMLTSVSSLLFSALNSWNTTNRVNRTVGSSVSLPPRKFRLCCAINTMDM